MSSFLEAALLSRERRLSLLDLLCGVEGLLVIIFGVVRVRVVVGLRVVVVAIAVLILIFAAIVFFLSGVDSSAISMAAVFALFLIAVGQLVVGPGHS